VLARIVAAGVLQETNVKDADNNSLLDTHARVVESTALHPISFQIRRLGDVQTAERRFPYLVWR
tara:strand:- start:586 stop:777 length:192 start_codon:yes stop_codon:yes gene_type:complete